MSKNTFLNRNLKRLFYSLSIVCLTPVVAQAVPAKIWTAWQPVRMNARECIRQAEIAVIDTGYASNLEVFGEGNTAGVYGERGEYSATVRCGINNGLVFFVLAGPSSNVASQELTVLMRNF